MSVRWLCRKLRQVGEGSLGRHGRHPPDRGLADLDAELEQFAVNAGGAPERVGLAHPADQITDLGAHPGPSQAA